MKHRIFKLILATLVAIPLGVGLLVIDRPAQANEPVVAAPDPMKFARGAKSWADNCSRCHNMRDPRELRDDQWRAAVAHMRVRAGLTGKEAREILVFLQGSN